jgi:Fe2+ transport system protein FeoA
MAGTATVVALDITGPERRRLMDLGILPGARVTAELRSPLGDPTAYRVRGSLIALRSRQARGIRVRLGGADGPGPEEEVA